MARAPAGFFWRVLRHAATLGDAIIPAAAGAVMLWLIALSPAERSGLFGEANPVDLLVERHLGAIVPSSVIAAFAILVLVVVARGAADALLYGRMRTAALRASPDARADLARGWRGFAVLSLLHVGVVLAGIPLLMPLVRRLAQIAIVAQNEPIGATWIVGAGALLVVGSALFRCEMAICAAHLVWEPSDALGTIARALKNSVAEGRLYSRFAIVWLVGHGTATGLAAVIGASFLQGLMSDAAPALAAILGLAGVGLLAFLFSAWLEASLVVVAGHLRGDCDADRMVPEIPMPPSPELRQERLDPPVAGAYFGADAAHPFAAVVSFSELLGGLADAHDGRTSAGEPEVVSDEFLDAIALSGGSDAELDRGSIADSVDSPRPPAVFDDLGGGLGRATFRTTAGAPEVSWRPR